MRPSLSKLLLACLTSFGVASVSAQRWGFPYGEQKLRGVNLGGWLVTEPWITPSLFDNTGDPRVIDEWTFGQYLDRGRAQAILRNHWDTFITEADFAEIAGAGLNHVRLPIGYWAFEVGPGEPYISGQLPYLQRAIGWAEKYGLKVIIDLHGAPGSQNGFDNSGQKMDYPTWHTKQSNVDRTNAVIKRIADMFKDSTAVVPMIAPLNEPAGYRGDDVLRVTRQFWYDSYGNIRYPYGSARQSDTVVMISDAFQPLSYWSGFMAYPGFEGVMIDTHHYQIFNDELNRMSPEQHIQMACSRGRELAASHLWIAVGEWSPARTDCARYLNGRGVGSRFEGTYPGSSHIGSCRSFTGPASGYSQSYKNFLRQFWEAQTIAFERGGDGWIQWTWKAEEAHEWSYQAGLRNGWIPRNPTDRMYPNICG
ncbi:exo-beta-1,3-glucanase [Coprinopsis cinerea okayama7|uniref:glucan 1,3-beta-glucosidase n=1 Tax=Coprinopsis cinerea (strain Okayama-7 / 130 / ATCC MYA-4618 / FGSC 9003) TaxID=240176 RepID=A8N2Z2_COPC7|nr:exo-beta-1,3-glucanase [Coprinopsis cinerea okayama7\|eukprot:XP_001829227.1 exo-beta-1,3-glucanase [Coprinopsis cinerea okayama7\